MNEMEILDQTIQEWEDVQRKVAERLHALRSLRGTLADQGLLASLRQALEEDPAFSEKLSTLLLSAGLRLARPGTRE